jgi:diguanylate cyclase
LLHARRTVTVDATVKQAPEVAQHAELAALAAASMFKVSRSLQTELARAREEVGTEKQKSQTLSAEARTDKLTGLANRRVFDEELDRWLEAWRTTRQQPVSLVLIDVDHFKQINDRYGHATGDAALQWLARIARTEVSEAGLTARYGGEEFAVIMPGVTTEDAIDVAERLRAAVEAELFHHNGQSLRLTASFGLATSLADEVPKSLIHRSDEALYAAKRNGRNRVYLHDEKKCVAATTVEKRGESGYNRGDRIRVAG